MRAPARLGSDVVQEGMGQCALQGVPHLTLLERSFYESQLRPLLTHWALLWLRRNRVQHGSDEHIVAYLSRNAPRPSADGLTAGASSASSAADDPLHRQAQGAAAAAEAAKAERLEKMEGAEGEEKAQAPTPEELEAERRRKKNAKKGGKKKRRR